MNDTERKYKWLVQHLIWNGSKSANNTFWVKISESEADILKKDYNVVDSRAMKGGIRLDVIRFGDNNVVLDTRQ